MAAKPPKPPGNFLKSLLNQHNNNKNQSQLQQQQQQNNEYDDIEGNNNRKLLIATSSTSSTETTINPIDCNTTTSIEATKKSNCNCSNISIMHLFHEMKQEFPTIPDTIVAQCVNENCHQRENCIQMLRNELELNPIPAQSYPAKVLHPPNNNQQHLTNNNNTTTTATTTTTSTTTTTTNCVQKPPLQQKPVNVQQKPPLKPLKPIRTAPLQPPNIQQCSNNINNNNNSDKNSTKTNTIISKNTSTNKQLCGEDVANNNGGIVGNHVGGLNGGTIGGGGVGGGGVDVLTKITPQYKQSISTTSNVSSTTTEVNNNDNVCNNIGNGSCVGDGAENVEKNTPRQRPTTLNLNTQLQKQQQQQRQRLNVQLQQRFQEQRNRQQQQQQQTQNHTTITKPIRKAPLPPIAPKPSQFQTNLTNTKAFNSFLNDSLSSNNSTTSPLSESEISVSVSLSTPSPTSPNNPTHHHQHHQPFNQHQTHLQTKSPIRHRSVITLQPEPPYTRDFLFTPASLTSTPTSPSLAAPPTATATPTSTTIQTTSSSSATSSPTASVANSQKSFTSVNLTLRPPVSPTGANSALQPSTIDITAGPGFSGASGGGKSLHYSSTSYDARLGYQQNFQITVTDEGGVFSACRIRPQQQQQRQRCLNQVNISKENQYDGNSGTEINTNQNNYINSFLNAEKQQQQQQQQQFHNNNVVALQQNIQNSIQSPNGIGGVNTSSGFGSSGVFNGGGGNTSTKLSGNMCLPSQQQQQQAMDDNTQEILQRQKKKRDKLAAALREYKKRLVNVEQEINLLTGTIPTEGLSERLDEEIIKLRRDCQDMVRSSSTFSQPPLQQELAINYQPNQQQPQPFPRQRITRPPPRPPPPRQTSLDIIQHHSQSSTPHTPPAASLPNLNTYNSPQLQQYHSSNSMTSPSYYHQQSAPLLPNGNNSNSNYDMYTDSVYNDDEPLVDDVDEYEDEYEEVIEPWECNMCTFRNHPQLNICETCENVRILPGRLSNLPRTLSATNCTNLTAATTRLAPASIASSSGVSPTQGLLRGPSSGSSNGLNHSNSSSRNGLNNTSNGNLEHDTNFAQQQLQNFALHT